MAVSQQRASLMSNIRGILLQCCKMDKMVETALPEDLESIGMRQLYNIELPGRMEQEKGVE